VSTTWVLLALLVLATAWFEVSGLGPRWRAWLESAIYRWVTKDRRRR
jgi:hypothetical protein